MHRTALIGLLAVTIALGAAAPAAADRSPAQVTPPVAFQGLEGDADSGTLLLEDGSVSIAASVTGGSIDVWTKTVPCFDRNEGACFENRATTSRSSIEANRGTVSITPREDRDDHLTGLLIGTDARLGYEADEGRLGLRSQDETVTLTGDDDAPRGMSEIPLTPGADLKLPGGSSLTVQGPFQATSFDSIIEVQSNGSEDRRIVTGWTWYRGEDAVQWYHELTLVRAKLSGALATPWDGHARLAAGLPAGMTADEAHVRVHEGTLGTATPESGNTTLEDVELTVTGIQWNTQATSQSTSQPRDQASPIPALTTGEARAQPSQSDQPAGWFLVESGLEPSAPPQPPQDEAVSSTTVVSAGAAALLAAGLAAYYWPRLSWLATTVFLPLYSRIEKDEILENEVRETLYELIQDDPGIHAHALSEEAEVGWGTTVYHLRRLERNGFVTSEKKGRYRRFFPAAGFLARQREVLSVLQNETTNDIARLILREPGLNQKAVCEALDISPSLANWHINRLLDADLVERERRGRTVHYTPGPAWQDIKDAVDLDVDDAVLDEAAAA